MPEVYNWQLGRTVLGVEADIGGTVGDRTDVGEELGAGEPDEHVRVHAACGGLRLGLRTVPTIDHEDESIGGEYDPAGRPGEAGEPPDVGEVGDDERGDARRLEASPHARRPIGVPQRRQRGHPTSPSFVAIAWTASAYPAAKLGRSSAST